MPELPEVETTLRGLQPSLVDRRIVGIEISQPKLRWPIPDSIYSLINAKIQSLQRRAKYLLIHTDKGHMIWHLGMSGSMRVLPDTRKQVDLEVGPCLWASARTNASFPFGIWGIR